ncbi:hypothetical protein BC829DRAFT_166187 [Chytridium lagenaria]|nr:hypothetical protein BC829DRAFT_166187 [Chytridium lagenaria]
MVASRTPSTYTLLIIIYAFITSFIHPSLPLTVSANVSQGCMHLQKRKLKRLMVGNVRPRAWMSVFSLLLSFPPVPTVNHTGYSAFRLAFLLYAFDCGYLLGSFFIHIPLSITLKSSPTSPTKTSPHRRSQFPSLPSPPKKIYFVALLNETTAMVHEASSKTLPTPTRGLQAYQ